MKKTIRFKLNYLFEINNKMGILILLIFISGFAIMLLSASFKNSSYVIWGVISGFCVSFIGTFLIAFLFQKFSDFNLELKGSVLKFYKKKKEAFKIDLNNPHSFLVVLRYERNRRRRYPNTLLGVLRRLLILISQGKHEIMFEVDYDYVVLDSTYALPHEKKDFTVDPLLENLNAFIDGKDFKGKLVEKRFKIPSGAFFITPAKFTILGKEYDSEIQDFLKHLDNFYQNNTMLFLIRSYPPSSLSFKDILNLHKKNKWREIE